MSFILQSLIAYLWLYRYTTIFVISFSAAFVVPIPSGSVLMAAGAFARLGYFNIFLIIIISIIGNILGDNIGYWIARKYGAEVLSGIGFRRVLQSKGFKNIEGEFSKHPGFIVFASRFEVLSTLSVNLLSGISKTPYRKFLIYESLGTISQVCAYSMIGYFFAYSLESVKSIVGKITLTAGLFIVVLIMTFLQKIRARARKRSMV